MNKTVTVVAAFLIAVTLSACGTSGGISGGSAQTISGQVADYSGPAGTLEALANYDGAIALGEGEISVSGNFSFELYGDVPEAVLSPIGFECEGIIVSNPDAKSVVVSGMSVVTDGGISGNLLLSNVVPNSNSVLDKITARYYVDQDVTVQGTCDISNGSDSLKQTVNANLNLKRGWNIVSIDYNRNEANDIEEARIYSGSVSGLKWFYYKNRP